MASRDDLADPYLETYRCISHPTMGRWHSFRAPPLTPFTSTTEILPENSDLCIGRPYFFTPFLKLEFESCSFRKGDKPTSKDVINVPHNKAVALERWYLSNKLIVALL